MAHVSTMIANDIEQYLSTHQTKGLLRFITCGSVDDGKSTLIGRLLYESKMLFEDQLSQLEADSKKVGTQGGDLDSAPSANRASPSTSLTVFSRLRSASSSSPIRRDMNSTRAIW
jgi:hypothetical protein